MKTKTFIVTLKANDRVIENIWDEELKTAIKSGLRHHGVEVDAKQIKNMTEGGNKDETENH